MTGHLGPRLPSQIVAAVGIGSPREMLATFRQHMEELREQHPGEPDRALAIILEEMLASELVKRPASAPEDSTRGKRDSHSAIAGSGTTGYSSSGLPPRPVAGSNREDKAST